MHWKMHAWQELNYVSSLKLADNATGTFGAATGAVLGVIRGAPPGLTFALGGIRWFTIGGVFSGRNCRLLAYHNGC